MKVPAKAGTALSTALSASDARVESLALLIARDEYAGLDLLQEEARLDEIAGPLLEADLAQASPTEQAERLRLRVYEELGFRGNEDDYYDPRNSWLSDVMRRKTGIPITLAIILIAVGRRAGFEVRGVGFPGHFLARVGRGEGAVYVDPFFGGRLLVGGALDRLAARFLGSSRRLRPEHLAPVDPRSIVIRMLVNLKHAHERRQDHPRALVATDRLVELTGSATFRRDRGLHALALGALEAAEEDLLAYLAETPDPGDRRQIELALLRAQEGAGRQQPC